MKETFCQADTIMLAIKNLMAMLVTILGKESRKRVIRILGGIGFKTVSGTLDKLTPLK